MHGVPRPLPRDWWLVDHGLKHGMMTVRSDTGPVPQVAALPSPAPRSAATGKTRPRSLGELPCPAAVRTVPQNEPPYDGATAPPTGRAHHMEPEVGRGRLAVMTVVSFAIFGAGFLIAGLLGNLTMQ
ncbi:hypothetical protein ACFTY7_10395 [Streptomyces sp. NPDC057062]|uniref:hypothetical protein n=1 Tax=Streptomyces sp. NPDC057062 TaxID=3346011 RepID=UPI003633EF11